MQKSIKIGGSLSGLNLNQVDLTERDNVIAQNRHKIYNSHSYKPHLAKDIKKVKTERARSIQIEKLLTPKQKQIFDSLQRHNKEAEDSSKQIVTRMLNRSNLYKNMSLNDRFRLFNQRKSKIELENF